MTDEILELVEAMEEYVETKKTSLKRAGEGKKGKWKRDKIEELLRRLAEIIEDPKEGKVSGRTIDYEVIYDKLYEGSEEHKERIFNDDKALMSWCNTFIKIANTIAKNNGIPIHVGRVRGEMKFKFTKVTSTAALSETAETTEE